MKELVKPIVDKIYKEGESLIEMLDEYLDKEKRDLKIEKWEDFLTKRKITLSKLET